MATNYCSMQELNEKLENIEQTSNQEISVKINFFLGGGVVGQICHLMIRKPDQI